MQTRPTRTALKSARQRVATLQAELTDASTVRLGKAAVASVQGSLDAAEFELAKLEGRAGSDAAFTWAEAL